jgi:hypothetical protein
MNDEEALANALDRNVAAVIIEVFRALEVFNFRRIPLQFLDKNVGRMVAS